jgi:DNA polymerase-3 subunit epsilon
VIDVETTGLGVDAEIVAIAVLDPSGGLLLDTLVRPRGSISISAQRIHGLTDEDVRNAPSFTSVYDRLRQLTDDRTAVAYHAVFDRAALDAECHRARLSALNAAWECALERYAEWRGFKAALATVCEIEGLPPRPFHRARTDAELTWMLLQRMAGLRA